MNTYQMIQKILIADAAEKEHRAARAEAIRSAIGDDLSYEREALEALARSCEMSSEADRKLALLEAQLWAILYLGKGR